MESTCGFCLSESHTNELWKCECCSWIGHPACWMMLRQEIWNGKNKLIYVHPQQITPWKLPTGQCPQCRKKFAWESFIQKHRVPTCSIQTNDCWICQETICPIQEQWFCAGTTTHQHNKIHCHTECLWKWSGYGVCLTECIYCGSVPEIIKQKIEYGLTWQKKIIELHQNINETTFYKLFFQLHQKNFCWKEIFIVLDKYLEYIQNGPMLEPDIWWTIMFHSMNYIFEQMKTIQTFLLVNESSQEEINQNRIIKIEKINKYLSIIIDSKQRVIDKYPDMNKVSNIHWHRQNRISFPEPGDFFPYSWWDEYKKEL